MTDSSLAIFESLTKELHCNDAGEGFTSLRGLGRMCGIDYSTWNRGDGLWTVEIVKYLAECGLEVMDYNPSKGVPDTLASMIIGFYAEEKQNETAKKYSRAFRAYGLRKAIQEITGYIPVSKTYQIADILLRNPAAWELMFTSEWIAEAEKLTGWKWSYRCMGKFINNCVYAYLPSEVVEALKGLNPVNDNGSRDYKHHQFLQPEIRERVTAHLQGVELLMKAAKGNMKIFEALMVNSYGSFKMSGQDDMPLLKTETVFLINPA